MAFTIEDCTGLELANSMASVAEFDTYFTDRGNTDAVALTQAVKESLLIKGADYLKTVFEWTGDKLVINQNMPFPRLINGATVCTPLDIKYAQIELAFTANDGDLLTNVGQKVVSEQVSSIKVTYSEYSNEQLNYSAVYNLVKPYLDNSSSYSHKVVRA